MRSYEKVYPKKALLIVWILFTHSYANELHEFFKSKGFLFVYDVEIQSYTFANKGITVSFNPDNKFVLVNDRVYRLKDMPKTMGSTLVLSKKDLEFVTKLVEKLTPQSTVNFKAPSIEYEDLQLPDFMQREQDKKKINYIFVDAGHGGTDPGSVAYGIEEKKLTLKFAQDLSQKIKFKHPTKKVILTRTDDTFISLYDRSRSANIALKENKNAVFISVHFNAWFDSAVRGFEIYYLSHQSTSEDARLRALVTKENFSIYKDSLQSLKTLEKIFGRINIIQYQKESKTIADNILSKVVEKLPDYPVMRGLKSDLFYVLKGTLMPAVLVEVGFVTNRDDMEFFNNNDNRDKMIEAIVEGLSEYVKEFDSTNGFVKKNYVLKD